MKEVVLRNPPYMNASEQRIADMHSLLNILNILAGELSLIQPGQRELVARSAELDEVLQKLSREAKESGSSDDLIVRVREIADSVIDFANSALNAETLEIGRTAIRASISNLESVFSILQARLDELEARMENPDLWVEVAPELFREQFEDFFRAVAANSKGGYRIVFDPADKAECDYYFGLKVTALCENGLLWMPLRLMDVLRDLAANARKYTLPGGEIVVTVEQDEHCLNAVVEDNGCGIPEDEIEKVAEFGYRASNVQHRPSFGGGFGLTKAVWSVANCGGSLTIASEVDVGTAVRISIPNAPLPTTPMRWTS